MFAGTRVPVQTLLDDLEAGESIDDFVTGFPSVKREQVMVFLEDAKDGLIESTSREFFWMNALSGACRARSSGMTPVRYSLALLTLLRSFR